MKTLRTISLALTGILLLSSCSKTPDATTPPVAVTGARTAVLESSGVLRQTSAIVRASPLLGIYAGLLLAGELATPVTAAREGIDVQLMLHAPISGENIDNLYVLLEELGAVLHVDITDLMNRSDDRANTLDAYATGLSNITERSKRRAEDVNGQISTLKARQREEKKVTSDLDKEIRNAVKAKDYATAQDRQGDLTEARNALTGTESSLKEMENIRKIFEELIEIADKRIAAIGQNREVLIAGLRVIDMPGVEDLGVLEQKTGSRRRSGGASPFGGF